MNGWLPGTGRRQRAAVRCPGRSFQDDEQERKLRLLLLSKGAVSARRFEPLFAAEMDDDQQS
jgi:hypothetical protein